MKTDLPIRLASNLARAAVTHEKYFSFMGQRLLFQTNQAALLDAAAEAFENFPPAPAGNEPPLVLKLFVSQDLGEYPPYPPLVCRSHGHLFYLSVGPENTIVSDLRKGYTFGYLTQRMAADRAFIRYTFIEAAAQSMLGMSRGYVAIHAACVVKNGVPLMISGPSGTGKSTLAYACLKNGYQLLTEDSVQARISQQGIELWGLPWKLHLLPDNHHFFPELEGLDTCRQVNGELKIEIDVLERFPGGALPHASAGPIVFLERPKKESRPAHQSLALDEALRRFEAIWSWETGWKAEFDSQLKHLLGRGAYHLLAGDTPDETVQELEKIYLHWTGCG
jgi:hypothetical protein